MYNCLTDFMVSTNLTIVNANQSKEQAVTKKLEQINGWWEDDERCSKKSL